MSMCTLLQLWRYSISQISSSTEGTSFPFFYPSTSNTIFLILSTSFKKILIVYFWLLGIKCIGERTHLRAFGNRVMSNDCWNVIWTEVFFLIQYWCKLLTFDFTIKIVFPWDHWWADGRYLILFKFITCRSTVSEVIHQIKNHYIS